MNKPEDELMKVWKEIENQTVISLLDFNKLRNAFSKAFLKIEEQRVWLEESRDNWRKKCEEWKKKYEELKSARKTDNAN